MYIAFYYIYCITLQLTKYSALRDLDIACTGRHCLLHYRP